MLLLLACAARPHPAEEAWSWTRAESLPEARLSMAVTGRGRGAARLSYTGGGSELLDFVGYAFVLEHPTQGVLVIDPGYPLAARDPTVYPGEFMANATGLWEVTPLAEQLPEAGITGVDHLLITHGHADHAGGVSDFPEATLHVLEEEWAFAAKESALHAVVPGAYVEHSKLETLRFDGGPYGPFPSHHDLFGDGSVIVLPTPGHTPAHSSVLVNLPGGSWLILGDAAWHERHWRTPEPKGRMTRGLLEDDPAAAWEALLRVNAWAARHPELQVLAGHEPLLEERYPTFPGSLP